MTNHPAVASTTSEVPQPALALLTWDIPEASLCIRLRSNALNRLIGEDVSRLSGGGYRYGDAGILLGYVIASAHQYIVVEDYQSISEDAVASDPADPALWQGALNELISRWNSGAGTLMEVVGCYFITRPGTDLDEEECQQYHRNRTPESMHLALLLSRKTDLETAAAFLIDQPERPPFALTWEYSRVRSDAAKPPTESVASPSRRIAALSRDSFSVSARARTIAAVALILLGVWWIIRPRMAKPIAPLDTRPQAAITVPPGTKTTPPLVPAPSTLTAVLNDRTIYINWGLKNVSAPSESGFMTIQDGPLEKVIPLEDINMPGQIVYVPRTEDVQISLRTDAQDSRLAGYVRVFNATPPPPLQLEAAGRRIAGEVSAALKPLRHKNTGRPAQEPVHLLAPESPHSAAAEFDGNNRTVNDSIINGPLFSNSLGLQSFQPLAELKLPVQHLSGALLPMTENAGLPPVNVEPPKKPTPAAALMPDPNTTSITPPSPKEALARHAVANTASQMIPPVPVRRVKPYLAPHEVFAPGTIEIVVTVDASGSVVNAQERSRGAHPLLAMRALSAAKQWKFKPARMGGKDVPAEFVVRFNFTAP